MVGAVDVGAFIKELFELLRALCGAEYSSVQQLVFCYSERHGLVILLPLARPVCVLRYLVVRFPLQIVRAETRLGH